MFLGDSTAMPQGVRAEEGTAFLLEQALARMLPGANTEVINRSVGGFNFHHYALQLTELLSETKPDLVVFFVCPNDSELHYLPLDASLESTARLQWAAGSPLLAHLDASARRASAALGDTPAILFGINYLDMPGAADMDSALRSVAECHRLHYATTRGRLDTLPMERLVATDADHHPSAYVHMVAVNEICLKLTRDLRVHQQHAEPLDAPSLVAELCGRMTAIPVQSAAFQAELLRTIDLLTQKANHLRKGLRASELHGTISHLSAARSALLAVLSRLSDELGAVVRQRGHEHGLIVPDEFPLEMYQRIKLLNARVHDTLARNLDTDPALPWVDAGPEPSPPGQEKALLQQLTTTVANLRDLSARLRTLGHPNSLPDAISSLPPELSRAVTPLWSHVVSAGRELLVRAESRQRDAVALIDEAVSHGADLARRAPAALAAGGLRKRAIARSMHQYIDALQLLQGGYFQLPATHVPGHTFWTPADWDGAEHAPQWRCKLSVSAERTTAIGLWVDSITPSGFFADYQQVPAGPSTFTLTFPHTREFFLKLSASAPFTLSALALTDGVTDIPAVAMTQRSPAFWRSNDILKVSP
jgi:hypothetical protein